MRSRSTLLTGLWHLLAPLYTHDTTAFFTLLPRTTPPSPPLPAVVAELLGALHSRTRQAACELLEAVYDTIEVDEARRQCDVAGGAGEAEWQRLVEQRGWVVDGSGFVRLRRRVKERSSAMGLEELDRLTRYVTELEQ